MLLGFKERFEAAILARRKRHTIRAKRKRRPRVGETCHCYVNLRQKSARLLGRWPCVKIQDIVIEKRGGYWTDVFIDGVALDRNECAAFAQSDGFENFEEMMKFWEGRLPFEGDIIHWDPKRPRRYDKRAARRMPE